MMEKPNLEALAKQAVMGDRAALDAVLDGIQDDVYRLSKRMLGARGEAEDATQEILIRVVTHLGGFRGDSSLKTWVQRIASRHLMRMRRGRFEEATDFALIERMIDEGDGAEPVPVDPAHANAIAEEVRMGCTQAMLSALDRDHRIAYILGDIFELSSPEAADVLDIDAATYRKRLQRARLRLSEFMRRKCGIVNPVAACRCLRQIPVLTRRGLLDVAAPQLRLNVIDADLRQARGDMDEVERVARALRDPMDGPAPSSVLAGVRRLLENRSIGLFDS